MTASTTGGWWTAIRPAVAGHEPQTIDVDGRPAAAVLVALLPAMPEPRVLLTIRSQEVEHHKGEISFPGGMIEANEDPQAAALREAWEEVGIRSDEVEVLGPLSHFVTRSGFHVRPFAGVLPRAPYDYRLSAVEVADVLEVPLGHLMDEANSAYYHTTLHGSPVIVREYLWGEHVVTGATAWMLRDFLRVLAAQMGREHV